MQIKTIRAFTGPNVFHNKPVLRMTLDLEELVDYDSTQLPGFSDLLLKLFPGLAEHGCSSRRPGGFVERLQRGTYLAHIIEHVAIELSESAGIPVTYGKTISAPEPRCYYVVVRYKSEQGMRRLLEMAVELVHALLAGGSFPLAERLEEARHIVEDTELGPSTRALADAATAQGIPWSRISEDNLLRLGYGQYVKYVQAAVSSGTSHIAVGIASNKSLAKQLMAEAGVPVARGTVVETVDQARDLLESLTLPVVVKPLTGNHGNGITMNVDSLAAMTSAFASAQAVNRSVLVEEQLEGKDYRVLVVNGCLVAASHRKVPTVTGNGEHTIEQLITNLNANPRRGEGHEKPLTKVPRDSRLITVLAQQGLGLHDTPARGHSVRLQNTANLSTGATAADVTDEVHPDIRETCERAARAVGLDICGVDLVVPSIAEPYTSGGIIEVNAGPGLRMHMFPESGKPRDVGGAIIDMLYPKKHTGRIPIVSVTGTNGKTTTTRLIGHTLSASGLAVGMTTSDGVYVGGRRVREGDTTGPQSARTVLADRSVEVAVLETARG
ncbi:MAG: cyanophycin synthetase family protein, partial [Nitrospira sp.]